MNQESPKEKVRYWMVLLAESSDKCPIGFKPGTVQITDNKNIDTVELPDPTIIKTLEDSEIKEIVSGMLDRMIKAIREEDANLRV